MTRIRRPMTIACREAMRLAQLTLLVLLVAHGSSAGTASAAAGDPEPPFMSELFPPDLIMKHGRDVGLRKEQRKAITEAVGETQATALELQWEMQDAAQSLTKLMSQPRIDESAALDAAKRMMDLEGRVKRAHLRLLIRIKSALDPEQQARLKELRGR